MNGVRKAPDLVVDASVAIKLFLPEELSEQAANVFSSLEANPPVAIYVPEFFYIECANVFRSRVKRQGMSGEAAKEAFAILSAFPFRLLSTAELSAEALDLALDHDLSVYDACYAAAASRLKAPLVTADQRLVHQLVKSEVKTLWLGDYPVHGD